MSKSLSAFLFQYNPVQDKWQELDIRLRIPRSSPTVFQVPKSMFNDC